MTRTLRLWPWRASLLAWAIVVVFVGALRHWDFQGIQGFSTTNYGWLAFSLLGGIGLSFRLAGRSASWQALLHPLLAAALSFAVCFVMVAMMGLVFIPGQSLGETLTTDAPGRAFWISVLVALVGYLVELLRMLARGLQR